MFSLWFISRHESHHEQKSTYATYNKLMPVTMNSNKCIAYILLMIK